jgi:3-methyl-2-oxobutanoate hydroxymethyltransferase
MQKLDAKALLALKGKQTIPMLTAYNYPVACSMEKAGLPVILVGDSVGMVEMGFSSTRDVTVEHIQYHIGAVRRGAPNTHIIGDMPYDSDNTKEAAYENAVLLIEAGADSVKLEGPKYDVIKHLVNKGIDVVGHSGLTPQTAQNFKQVGQDQQDASRIIEEAKAIEAAGAFMLVLEHIPATLGSAVTQAINIPTIGIGAGSDCDGQVLVINDALGLGDYWPPFSKQYAQVSQTVDEVVKQFMQEVTDKQFP